MNTITADRLPVTRRRFLQAIGLAFARSLHPVAAGFTAIADELVWLMRICTRNFALSCWAPRQTSLCGA